MEKALQRIYSDAEIAYQEVVLLVSLYNDDHQKNGPCKQLLGIEEDMSRHLLVKSFALVLGSSFEAHCGKVLQASVDLTRSDWVKTVVSYVMNDKHPQKVLTKEDEHSWLCIKDSNVWVDILPQGSGMSWLTPVKYLPGPRRPGYSRGLIDKKNTPSMQQFLEFSKYLEALRLNRDPRVFGGNK